MSRKLSSQMQTLSLLQSTPKTNPFATTTSISSSYSPSPSPTAFPSLITFFPHRFSTLSENVFKKVDDVILIATDNTKKKKIVEVYLRRPGVLALITGVLLQKEVAIVCPNLGYISVSMSLFQLRLCFVCSHFSSGQKDGAEKRRNFDVNEILKPTHFSSIFDTDTDEP
ncbi:hypothetical protein HAX54_015412 [Datura stramonium]|uniref:Uncharacterized protein n=1 Tax=Datura stramonium TaxID=4076 RepID=A0ABS8TS83_DATST|nr:hypothetical protein [Datura stramonium]